MAAHWISYDGSGLLEGSVPLKIAGPPAREFRTGRFTFRRARRSGRWGCQVSDRGATQYRTPFGAFRAVRRMLRES